MQWMTIAERIEEVMKTGLRLGMILQKANFIAAKDKQFLSRLSVRGVGA
jgi:uncharacterized protein YktB (UPF0637 family)